MKFLITAVVLIGLTSCKTIESVPKLTSKGIYNQLICFIIKSAQRTSSYKTSPNKCINIDPHLPYGGEIPPRSLINKGYDVSHGKYASERSFHLHQIDCLPEYRLNYMNSSEYSSMDTIELENSTEVLLSVQYSEHADCSNFVISMSTPYFITSDTVYVSFYLHCGYLCGEAYEAIFKILENGSVEKVYFDMTFIE